MIDIRALRENPKEIIELLQRRGVSNESVTELIEADSELRLLFAKRDLLRSRINELSKAVSDAYRAKEYDRAETLKDSSRKAGSELEDVTEEVSEAESRRINIWLVIPNVPDPKAPIGNSEDDNVVIRYWHPQYGASTTEPKLSFEKWNKIPHWDVGTELGILDLGRAAKLAGSMFPMFKGSGARMLRALTSFALDEHSDEFLEVRPPTFVRRETMISTGHLPKFSDDAYHIERDDLWAIPTAEVPLTSMSRDEILDLRLLPFKMTASTPCFRREAGSAGRDTRGLLRLHEFDKVELMVYATPTQSQDVFSDMLRRAEMILQKLKLVYRVVDLCTADLGGASRRTFDLEVFAPGVDRWLEVSSVSWCGDYQARRANIRYRDTETGQNEFVNTLNGSALAWPRVFAAILEVYRLEDGTVQIPSVLVPYLGGLNVITPIGSTFA